MINFILSLIQDPKKGYDPVPPAHVEKYFEEAYNGQRFNQNIIDRLENTLSLNNKKVLDLGAGPGQYTKYFVDQGAKAYYHDISLRYLRLFQEKFPNLKFNESGFSPNFSSANFFKGRRCLVILRIVQ